MWRVCGFAGLALCLAGCSSMEQDRARDYNEDGVCLFQNGRYHDSLESFQAAFALRPKDPGLMYNIGECYARLGAPKKAEKYFNDCLDLEPNHGDCRHALAQLMVNQGRIADAERMIADWMNREPQLATVYAEDGWLLHQKGDLPLAQARLLQALELDPRDVRALTELGLIYEAMNRPDRAAAVYGRAVDHDPRQSDITDRLNYLLSQGAGRPRPD